VADLRQLVGVAAAFAEQLAPVVEQLSRGGLGGVLGALVRRG
jgi:hypothetical protein